MAAVAVKYVVEGPEDGPVLVFLNSLGSDLTMWDPQAAALSDEFRVVRYDARGHGCSPVPPGPYSLDELGEDLLALLDRLRIERASLCGISLGGATALWMAARAPERVDRLVVAFSTAWFGPPDGWLERAELVRAQGTQAVDDEVLRRWITPPFAADHPELLGRLRASLLATHDEGYAAATEAVGALDLRADLAAIRAPTLIVSGSEDPATPPEHGRRLAAGIFGAEFVELEGCAHLGNLERPELFTERIGAFLRAGVGDAVAVPADEKMTSYK